VQSTVADRVGEWSWRPADSEDPSPNVLEFHGTELQSEDINPFETMTVEGCEEKANSEGGHRKTCHSSGGSKNETIGIDTNSCL
jgi:hypothetical protein